MAGGLAPARHLPARALQWQAGRSRSGEAGGLHLFTLHIDGASMIFGNPIYRCKSQTCCSPHLFGGKEWLKNPLLGCLHVGQPFRLHESSTAIFTLFFLVSLPKLSFQNLPRWISGEGVDVFQDVAVNSTFDIIPSTLPYNHHPHKVWPRS